MLGAFHGLRVGELRSPSLHHVATALGPCGAVWKKAHEGKVSRGRRKRKAISAAVGGSKAFKGRVGAGVEPWRVR